MVTIPVFCALLSVLVTKVTSAPTTIASKTLCKIDESKEPFLPNIYECLAVEQCCVNEGAPSCCGKEISKESIREQALMWLALLSVLAAVTMAGYCYFNDHYCCEGEPGDNQQTICCCIPRTERFAKDDGMDRYLYPSEVAKRKVDDPIFGNVGDAQDVPQYASVDAEIEQRAKYI